MKTNKIIVEVTQKDIDEGTKGSCYDCPIAYAIIKALNKHNKIKKKYLQDFYYRRVYCAKELSCFDISYKDIKWPKEIRDWIIAFDKGEKVQPFKFIIDTSDWFEGKIEMYNEATL